MHPGVHCGHLPLEHEVPSGGVVAIGAARPGAVAGHRQSAGCTWSQEGGFGVPRVAAPSAWRLGLVQIVVRLQRVGVRTSRYRTAALLARQTEQGISVNPLFSLRGFSAELICIDVLHSMDLGATQDAIGFFFDLVAGWVGTQPVFFFLYVCRRLCACVCVFVCAPSARPAVFCLPCRLRILLRAAEERPDC